MKEEGRRKREEGAECTTACDLESHQGRSVEEVWNCGGVSPFKETSVGNETHMFKLIILSNQCFSEYL